MKKIILWMILMFTTYIITAQDISLRQTIKGTIIDEQSGNVLSSATVMAEGISSSGDITDSLGNFKLKNVPIGRQTIRVSLVGYDEAIIRNIEVTSSKEVVLEIRLRERIRKLDEVTVTSFKQKNRALNDAAVVSARQFSVDEAVRYSGTRNDQAGWPRILQV